MVSAVGRNYARALFELAAEEGGMDAVGEDLGPVCEVLATDRDARSFLVSRVVGRPAKRRMISAAFAGRVDPKVLTLLLILADRGRIPLLPQIAEEYERLVRHARGLREVTVWSAFPLGAEEGGRLAAALEARFGGRVVMDVQRKAELIGGALAESEGQEIEFSLEGQLKALAGRITARQGGSAAGGG
jgi:F-type H+-transporting ATPase subunit delta